MKRNKKHTAAQFELGFANEPFALVGQVGQVPAPAAPASSAAVDPRQLEIDKPGSYRERSTPEMKVAKVRDCTWDFDKVIDSPAPAAEFWHTHVKTASWYRDLQESFVAVSLNCRRKPIGFHLVCLGINDTCLAHPREIFSIPMFAGASAIVLMHNHPSGDPSPSEADIKVSRDMKRAGELLKIDVLDSIIVGQATQARPQGWCSLRELGYFYS